MGAESTKGEKKPLRCSSCHNHYYNSRREQKEDWQRHRRECYPVALELIDQGLLRQALKAGLLKEYQTLMSAKEEGLRPTALEEFQLLLYGVVIEIIMRDPMYGLVRESDEQLLSDAYTLYYQECEGEECDSDAFYFAEQVVEARFNIFSGGESYEEEIDSPERQW